jgi:hypothetical protein
MKCFTWMEYRTKVTQCCSWHYHIAKSYNKNHKNHSLDVGDKVYLRLGNGYKLRGIPKAKLGLQRVGPFSIIGEVGQQAYKLQLPNDWKIHPIISIAQLKPAKIDLFERKVPPPSPVTVEGEEEHEIETIINAAMRSRGRNRRQYYLVRWTGYGPEHDQWIAVEEMEHAADLIEEFERDQREKIDVLVRWFAMLCVAVEVMLCFSCGVIGCIVFIFGIFPRCGHRVSSVGAIVTQRSPGLGFIARFSATQTR